ncbi:MAG TPA: aminotransferase class I/II-fold pyridoxal phosphate-dependent enzyme, partial [Arthrobacter sp.]|nr:aminotransferase class I/II-fold pyridoxal phosphate-dependent enzyme [Arthrobacter sp.]
SRAELAALTRWCAANEVRLVSDEIYHGITYPADPQAPDARGVCAWELDRTGVVISSFSKYWGMTGWRLGWALMPRDLAPAMDALAGNMALWRERRRSGLAAALLEPDDPLHGFGHSLPARGKREPYGPAAVDGVEIRARHERNALLLEQRPAVLPGVCETGQLVAQLSVEIERPVRRRGRPPLQPAEFAAIRQILLANLGRLRWGTAAPADGAFYLYAELGDQLAGFADSGEYCRALLEQEGVALVPGSDFDAVNGRRSVRLSFAAGREAVAEAVERIIRFQESRSQA